jgi:hypothetical protein
MFMKNLMMKISTMLAMVALFALVFGVSSCKKDDEPVTPPVVVLDGYYVKGSVTAYADFNKNAMMAATYNEVQNDVKPRPGPRAQLLELYIPIKAGAAGFSIVKVAGSVRTTYGPGAGFGVVTTPTTDEPKFPFQRGVVTSTNAPVFTVPTDGFYHVVFDTEYNKVAIMLVQWGMIGAATPGGWSNDTLMTPSAFNLTDMSWTLTGLTLLKGEWKFRYSHGWKVEIDTTNSDPTLWVKVNTNFGGAKDTLVPGGGNIVNAVPGIYTCVMAYKLGTGYTATLTKTANLPPINYSAYEMGIIGNAYNKPDGTPADWDVNFGTSLPTVTGTDYVWTYTLDLIATKEFKFRQGTDWSGKSIGYSDVTWAGAGASNFSNNGGNIKVADAGNYTLVLKIEAATETYTVTATKN